MTRFFTLVLAGLLGTTWAVKAQSQSSALDADASVDRTVLPVPEPRYPPITELDARDAKAPPRFEVKAPKGAPNVVIILLDNFGFGDGSTFGGPIQMPTLDRLAETGLRYNNFKVPPLCSPSRMALLTGRNSHSANFGVISEIATAFPGYTAMRPRSVTMLPEILRLNGYSTAMFGKGHELGPWEASVVGPFDRWPLHSGFERFYGFMAGEADLFHPVMYDNQTRLDLHPELQLLRQYRHHRQGHRLGAFPALTRSRQTIFCLLLRHWHPRPVPGARQVARQVQGKVRPGLGPGAQGNAGPPD